MDEAKLNSFGADANQTAVSYVETTQVKEGVVCDVYSFRDDDTRDLAIVTVEKGFKTPMQKVLKGDTTTEGFVSGRGELRVISPDGDVRTYAFDEDNIGQAVVVEVGEKMQWHANGDSSLVFYEVCSPPYEDGRFENIPEPSSGPLG